LKLFANVRPAKTYPGMGNYAREDVDLVIVRENTEDLYLGWEFNLDKDTVIGLRLTTKNASEKIATFAFETSKNRGKSKTVTAVHKSNVLRKGDQLFANTCREISKNYPDILFNEQYVDACSMNLIRNPSQYDVIVTTNLFGDILSDESAQIVGGLGMGPSANIGDDYALFEPVHGAAFDIAGKNIANPCSIFLTIKMMLEWLNEKYKDKEAMRYAKIIEQSIISLLNENFKTKDIGGNLSTTEFTHHLINKIKSI
jgi:3-isopropylmalate dehydrogenase